MDILEILQKMLSGQNGKSSDLLSIMPTLLSLFNQNKKDGYSPSSLSVELKKLMDN